MPNEHPSDHDYPGHTNDHPGSTPPDANLPDANPTGPKPRPARLRPPGRRRSSLVPVPPRRIPPLGSVSLDIRLNGPEEEVIRMVERLSSELPVNLCIEAFTTLPGAVWEQFPDGFLNQSERRIVREDLRLNITPEVARLLHVSTGTINAYRSTIRKQFLTIAPALRPAWMQAWLRRYPGMRPDQHAGAEGDAE